MDTRQFTSLLKNPALLHSISEEELQDAASRYPFSSLLQTLLVKKYQMMGETDLDTSLARAALLHPDREQLSDFIDRAIPDISALHYDEPEVAAPQHQPVPQPQPVAPVVEVATKVVEPDPVVEETIPAEEPVEEVVVLEFFPPDVEPIVLEELLKPLETEKGKPEEKPEPKATDKPKEVIPEALPRDKASFNQWLKRVKEGEVSDAQALDQQIQAVGYEAMLMRSAAPEKPVEKKPEKIEKPAKPEKPAKEEKSAKDEGWGEKVNQMAQRSVTFDDDLVTETLAKIFELQKKYSKALDAYEKLAIRFPDKSAQYQVAIERLKARLA